MDCWDISGSTSTTKSGSGSYNIWGVYSAGGTKMLRMNNYSVAEGTALINTPNIVVPNDGKNYELAFDYENSAYKSTTNLSFSVKVSKDGGSTFTELATYAKNSGVAYDGTPEDFDEATISLADYAGETIILQFFAYANYGYGAMFVKNIRIIAASSCTKPSALEYSNVTANSATLSWTAGGSETAWNIRYKADGDADWSEVAANTNPFTLSGLSDNTHYTAQVQADCGGEQSEWNSTAVSFSTNAVAPWSEDFEAQAINQVPSGWDNSASTATTASQSDKPAIWNVYQYPSVTGNKMIRMFNYYAQSGIALINTPSILIPASPAYELTFDYAHNASCGAFYVKVSTDGGTTFSEGVPFSKGSGSDKDNPGLFTEATIDLSAYAGQTIIIQFYANANFDNGSIFVDNIDVHEKPSCVKPTGLGYSAETAEGATLAWTAGGTESAWTIEYSTVSDFSSDTHEVSASTNPFTLTGLIEQTTYYVHVKAACDSENASDYSEAVSFTTKCATITSFPWTEDFEDETNETNVACWDNSASTCFSNTGGSTPSKYVWGVVTASGNKLIYMRNFNVRVGTALINTPSFTLPSDKNYEFTFKYSHLASCDPLVIKVSENGGVFNAVAGASYAASGSTSYSDPGVLTEASIDLSAYKGKTIALQFFTTANWGEGAIWVDDLSIHLAPSCFKPTLNEASAITPEGATFTWTASGKGETQYQYICVPTGETPNWSAATLTSALTATISDKAAGTYDFYVRSYCGTDDQSEAVSKSFTTATVPAPTGVTVTGITNNSATASWTAPDVTYPVQYQWKTSQTGSEWSSPTAALNAAISGLAANTTYTVYVRSYYSAGVQSAEATQTFTTACDPTTVDATHPFVENFNGLTTSGEIPACWDNSEVELVPYATTPSADRKWSYFATGHEGKCVRYNSESVSNGVVNVLATPQIILNADADLTFWAKNPTGGDYKVLISVNDGARENLIIDLTGIADWTKQEAPLTYSAGTKVQIFFVGTSNYGNSSSYLYLDDVQINPITCRKPAADPVVAEKDETHVKITWTAGGSNTQYQFCLVPQGETPVWDDENIIADLYKTFTDLPAVTSYDFYVRTYCDELNQSEPRKVSFRTSCGTFALPFEDNFNSLADFTLPECWDNTEGSIAEDHNKWRSYSKAMRFNSVTNEVGATNVLATPYIQLGDQLNLLTFLCKNPTGGDFKVQIQAEDIAREDLITELTGIADWTMKHAEIPAKFNNKKVQFFFCATSNNGDQNAYISIDDVRVSRGVAFVDGTADFESRLASLMNEQLDVFLTRPMQFDGYYNTLTLPFDLTAEQLADAQCPLNNFTVKYFDYMEVNTDNELIVSIAPTSAITAGVPYFVMYNGNLANGKPLFFRNVTITAASPSETVSEDMTFHGVFNNVALQAQSETSYNIIYLGRGNQLYWPATANTVKGFRAYFTTATSNPRLSRGMSIRLVEYQDTPTDVQNINADRNNTLKLLQNGQLIIIRDGKQYNAMGQVIE